MHIFLLENKPAQHWSESSNEWVRWRESAPVFKVPHGENTLRVSFEWKGQGWGNSKGKVKINLVTIKGDVIATEVMGSRAPHKWGNYDVTFDSSHELVSRIVNGSFYRISIRTGGGDGHELFIKNFELAALYWVPHHVAFSTENMVLALKDAQNGEKNINTADHAILDKALGISPCAMAIGYVVYDAVCLAIGGVGLRASMNPNTARTLAEAVRPAIPKIIKICATLQHSSSVTEQAKAVFQILSTIWSGGMGGAVLGAFLDSLTWYNAMLYGVTSMGTIVAALATDGVAFIAEVAILLATYGFFVEDSIKAVTACTK